MKDENGENLPHLEITEEVLCVVILLTTIIRKVDDTCMHLFLINHLVSY